VLIEATFEDIKGEEVLNEAAANYPPAVHQPVSSDRPDANDTAACNSSAENIAS
jgi:hypothetical protein